MNELALRIKGFTVKVPRMSAFARDVRLIGLEGDGTYSVTLAGMLPKIGKELGSNEPMCYTACLDNNQQAVRNALKEANPYSTNKPMLFWKNHFRLFLRHLPSRSDTAGGFGRGPADCFESAPTFMPSVIKTIEDAFIHDLKCGGKTSFLIEPFNWGSHLIVKMLQDLESQIRGLKRGIRVGLTTLPYEGMALEVFRDWFPRLLESGLFGVDVTVVSDEKLGSSSIPRRVKDEMILKGIVGTAMAFLYDSCFPGYRDIWKMLSKESNLIGVSAVEGDIIAWRRLRTFWRTAVDSEVSVIQIRRLIKRVLSDPKLRLIDAEVDKASPKVLVVIGRVERWVFDQAITESFIPDNVIPIFVPTNSYKVTTVLFYPLRGAIPSIERRFEPKNNRLPKRYHLPDTITKRSIRNTKDVVEKAAKFAGVSTEVLLNCKYN
jgi:hypothetical protein